MGLNWGGTRCVQFVFSFTKSYLVLLDTNAELYQKKEERCEI